MKTNENRMPALIGGFGNYFLPIHLGAPDYFKYLPYNFYCGAPPSFYSINNYNRFDTPSDLSNNKDNTYNFNSIGAYLAGLFEGDGHIILSKKLNSKGKIIYHYIAITFVNGAAKPPLVKKFIEIFGGRLRIKNKGAKRAIVWTISIQKELVNLINLMNGNLRTPKLSQFNALIACLNDKYSYNIPIFSPDTSDLNTNG